MNADAIDIDRQIEVRLRAILINAGDVFIEADGDNSHCSDSRTWCHRRNRGNSRNRISDDRPIGGQHAAHILIIREVRDLRVRQRVEGQHIRPDFVETGNRGQIQRILRVADLHDRRTRESYRCNRCCRNCWWHDVIRQCEVARAQPKDGLREVERHQIRTRRTNCRHDSHKLSRRSKDV